MKLGLAGDTMLGRGVGQALGSLPPRALFAPAVVEALALLGVDCVTLANNHSLDFGTEALLDTIEHLRAASGLPRRLRETLGSVEADAILVSPHWGPNMVGKPLPRIRRAAAQLLDAGATLVAGHSAHVFQGVGGRVVYDLGDFIDDYATDPRLRNDLGLLFLVTLDEQGPMRLEALPLKLDYCHTRLADGEESRWIGRRYREACHRLGTDVHENESRLVATWERPASRKARDCR